MWECPECHRRFGRAGQGHECAPAMTLDELFETSPEFEPPIVEAVIAHFRTLDPEIWFEALSVGVFFKRRTVFVSLRTMTRWVAVGFNLERRVRSDRLSRKVVEHGRRFYHVVNVRTAEEVDDELCGWLTEAWELDA